MDRTLFRPWHKFSPSVVIEGKCPPPAEGGTVRRYDFVGWNVLLQRQALRSHICSSHTQWDRLLPVAFGSRYRTLQHHVCHHAAIFPAAMLPTMMIMDEVSETLNEPPQLNVFLYKSCVVTASLHSNRNPKTPSQRTAHFAIDYLGKGTMTI